VHVAVSGTQLDDAGAVRQAQAAPVGAVVHLLYARNGASAEERDKSLGIQRRAVGQAQRQRAAVLLAPVSTRSRTQLAGRQCEHLLDRGVELAHALKAGGERHAGDRHGGGLEQDARGLRALGAGERERTGAHDGDELAVHVALGVAEPACEATDALAVDQAVSDQSHRASDEVRAEIPLGRARRCIRTAALTRAKAGGLRGRGGCEHPHVLAFGRARRTAGAAVDPGGLHTAEQPSVEARIGRLDGLPDVVRVEVHGRTVTHLGTRV
jgi:hypothetical protein